MKAAALALLFLFFGASLAIALTATTPVALPSKACCENCTVARYRAANVPVVETTMVTRALLVEAGLLVTGLAVALAARTRRQPPSAPAVVAKPSVTA